MMITGDTEIFLKKICALCGHFLNHIVHNSSHRDFDILSDISGN